MYESISYQDLIQVTIADGCPQAVQVQDGPIYLNTYGLGGPVINEFVSPEYDTFLPVDEDFYVDVLHNLNSDRITFSTEKYKEISPGVWDWVGTNPGSWKKINSNTRRFFFYPEPVKVRFYLIGGKTL